MVFEIAKRALPVETRRAIGRYIRNRNRKADPESVGRDFVADVRERLPHRPIHNIFDVGGFIGYVALEFADNFPEAQVYTFEPHETNFRRMDAVLAGQPGVKRYLIGMGATPGSVFQHFDPSHPSTAHIVASPNASSQRITIDTIDRFCEAKAIESIDILKIDVESHELQVLEGASSMLDAGRIGILKIECTADPDQGFHTQFQDLCEFLHPRGYRLFGVYDQYECWEHPTPKLRRIDAAWVSHEFIVTRG